MDETPYAVELSKKADKYLASLDQALRDPLDDALIAIARNPRGAAWKALQGAEAGMHRWRKGNWRIVYRIDDGQRLVFVDWIGDRKEVYR